MYNIKLISLYKKIFLGYNIFIFQSDADINLRICWDYKPILPLKVHSEINFRSSLFFFFHKTNCTFFSRFGYIYRGVLDPVFRRADKLNDYGEGRRDSAAEQSWRGRKLKQNLHGESVPSRGNARHGEIRYERLNLASVGEAALAQKK